MVGLRLGMILFVVIWVLQVAVTTEMSEEPVVEKRKRKQEDIEDGSKTLGSKYKYVYQHHATITYWRARAFIGKKTAKKLEGNSFHESLGYYNTAEKAANVVNDYFENYLGLDRPNTPEMFENAKSTANPSGIFKYVLRCAPSPKIRWLAKPPGIPGSYHETPEKAAKAVDDTLVKNGKDPVNADLLSEDLKNQFSDDEEELNIQFSEWN